MIDFIGIGGMFLVGIILFVWGSMIPDQTDIILQYEDQIVKLGTDRWDCGEDIQCQKAKSDSINAIKINMNTVQLSQNFRGSLIGLGLLIDIGTVIGAFLKFR